MSLIYSGGGCVGCFFFKKKKSLLQTITSENVLIIE